MKFSLFIAYAWSACNRVSYSTKIAHLLAIIPLDDGVVIVGGFHIFNIYICTHIYIYILYFLFSITFPIERTNAMGFAMLFKQQVMCLGF